MQVSWELKLAEKQTHLPPNPYKKQFNNNNNNT